MTNPGGRGAAQRAFMWAHGRTRAPPGTPPSRPHPITAPSTQCGGGGRSHPRGSPVRYSPLITGEGAPAWPHHPGDPHGDPKCHRSPQQHPGGGPQHRAPPPGTTAGTQAPGTGSATVPVPAAGLKEAGAAGIPAQFPFLLLPPQLFLGPPSHSLGPGSRERGGGPELPPPTTTTINHPGAGGSERGSLGRWGGGVRG